MEPRDVISLLGVICTGLFSWLLWKATRNIGNKQNELQEYQNKLQEYHNRLESNKAYRDIYICLNEVNKTCKMFFYYVEVGIIAIVDEKGRTSAQVFFDKIDNMNKEINVHRINMELQLTEYPKLTHDLDLLYLYMVFIHSSIKNAQMPSDITKERDIDKINILKNIIITLNDKIPNYHINQNTKIDDINNYEYSKILKEIRKILIDKYWSLEKFFENSDDEIIKHIVEEISYITDDITIESWCKQVVEIRERIFTENKILDKVKEKCVLK